MKHDIDRIYIERWLDLKPYHKQTKTDGYYLKLCNKVKEAILTNKQVFILQNYITEEEIDVLCCFLTSYFEDIISGTNIWNTFINIHEEMYGKLLPFYQLDGYDREEINVQDITFLTWYFLNTIQNETFIGPVNEFIFEPAEKIMAVFEDAWEFAPENELLKNYYQIDEGVRDFYVARNLIDSILFKSYLFYPDSLMDLRDLELELIEEETYKGDKERLETLLNENRDQLLHRTHTRLLALKGKEWAARIVGQNHFLNNHFLNLSQKISGYFLYKGQDENTIFIEHIASGKKFNLTKKSFDHSKGLTKIDTILYMGIVKWMDEWWFSGVFFQIDYKADLILDEKNSMASRMAVNFLDHQEQDMSEQLDKQLNAFKEFNHGSQIAFMESDKIEIFIRDYIEYFNKTLNLSEKEKKEAKQRARDDGFFGSKEEKAKNFKKVAESGLVFFNTESGVEVGLAINSAFPAPNNPFFNEEESEGHIFRLFQDKSLSTELAMYCIENFKPDLPFFKGFEGKLFLKDIDFLLRFWKTDSYYAKPTVTFVGKKE